jgi:hypothetical protein
MKEREKVNTPDKDAALKAFAEEVSKYHCWALGGEPCTLTEQQGRNLMQLGMQLAEKRGYDNGGTGGLGMHPTQDIPLASYEMWLSTEHRWYTVVMLVNWEESTARFYNAHKCFTWQSGCTECQKLRAEYKPEERQV